MLHYFQLIFQQLNVLLQLKVLMTHLSDFEILLTKLLLVLIILNLLLQKLILVLQRLYRLLRFLKQNLALRKLLLKI